VKVVFRVDASAEIGLGHLARCLSLAQALRSRGARCLFLARELGLALRSKVEALGFELRLLPTPRVHVGPVVDAPAHAHWARVGQDTDVGDATAALAGLQPDWTVVDHYAFDARWHRTWRALVGGQLVAIDDLGDRDLAVDLVVDHNVAADHSAKYAAVNRRGSPVLGGPAYAMLDPRFASAPRNSAVDSVRSIGIFMGGVDAPNLSERAWHGLRDVAGFSGNIEIAATRANPHLPRLAALAARDAATTLSIDAADLAAFFGRHELHVGAGGGATWERCCLGAPTLAVVAAENQRSVLLPLAHDDVFTLVEQELPDAGTIGQAARAMIANPALRRRQSERARALVDGHGCARIAERIASLCLR